MSNCTFWTCLNIIAGYNLHKFAYPKQRKGNGQPESQRGENMPRFDEIYLRLDVTFYRIIYIPLGWYNRPSPEYITRTHLELRS